MKPNSTLILEILKIFIWICTLLLCIGLSMMIFLFFTTIFGIDIGSMKEMKISLNIANQKIKDIQSLEKGKLLFVLAYTILLGSLELILLIYVIKILKKFNLNHSFSIEIYFLIEKIAKLALTIGCTSVIFSFIYDFITGKSSISLDFSNENIRFFLFAGVVYIIAQVYKKAVDLQEENDLTV